MNEKEAIEEMVTRNVAALVKIVIDGATVQDVLNLAMSNIRKAESVGVESDKLKMSKELIQSTLNDLDYSGCDNCGECGKVVH